MAQQEEEARRATQEARRLEDDLAQARAAAADAALQRDREARERVYQQEQITALNKRSADVRSEIEALSARLDLIRRETERLGEQDGKLRAESEQSTLSLQTAEEAYAEKMALAADAEAEIERARGELLSHTAVAERLREIARQLEGTLERLALQAEGLGHEGERAAAQHAQHKAEADKLDEEIRVAREYIAKLSAERVTAVDAVVQGHEAVSDTDAEVTRVRDEYSRTKHRLESLKELDERRAYYSSAVQFILLADETPRDFHFLGHARGSDQCRCEMGTRRRRRVRIVAAIDRCADSGRCRARRALVAREQRRPGQLPGRGFARRQRRSGSAKV